MSTQVLKVPLEVSLIVGVIIAPSRISVTVGGIAPFENVSDSGGVAPLTMSVTVGGIAPLKMSVTVGSGGGLSRLGLEQGGDTPREELGRRAERV